jgi:hypothetical protein
MFRVDAQAIERQGHLDAVQSVIFARELEEIDAQSYDVKYASLEAFELVPTMPLSPGTETYTYRQFDGRAIATMTSNYASGSPRADVSGLEFTSSVRSIRNSYGYNVQEIRAAAEAKRPLENMRAVSARRGINEKINRTALLGDAAHNIIGLFNQPNAQTFVVPAVGTGSSKLWTTKTADQILDDLYGIVDQIPTTTAEVERPTRLLMPYANLRFISRKRTGTGDGNLTVLQCFRENRPQVEVRGALFLDTAGAAGVSRMVAYDPKPENLQLLLPIPFESFPPQLHGMEYVVENHARMGGVVNRYPLAMCYGDGI